MQYGVVQYGEIQCHLYCVNSLILTGTDRHTSHTTFTGKERAKGHAPFPDAKANVFDITSK